MQTELQFNNRYDIHSDMNGAQWILYNVACIYHIRMEMFRSEREFNFYLFFIAKNRSALIQTLKRMKEN